MTASAALRGPFGDRVCLTDTELRLGSEEEDQKTRTPREGTSASHIYRLPHIEVNASRLLLESTLRRHQLRPRFPRLDNGHSR